MSKTRPDQPGTTNGPVGGTLDESQAGKSATGRRVPSAGLLFQKKHDLPITPVSSRYLIFSSQRSGSNYLCRRLCNVDGRLGLPSEYLHPNSLRTLSARLVGDSQGEQGSSSPKVGLGRYLKAVESVRTTADGCFGIKVQPHQLLSVAGENKQMIGRFLARFDHFVFMTRGDKLGQAISGALAQRTGTWFNDGKEPEIKDSDYPTLMLLIASNLARYMREDRFIQRVAAAVKKPVLQIQYEDVEKDGDAVFKRVVEFLSPGVSDISETGDMPMPERPEGKVAAELRQRFLGYVSGKSAI